MTGIVLQTTAIKVVNKGGGSFKLQRGHRFSKQFKTTGTDYIVFKCPGCGARNKTTPYEAKYQMSDGNLVFGCKTCRREIDLAKPLSEMPKRALIVSPEEHAKEQRKKPESTGIQIAR